MFWSILIHLLISAKQTYYYLRQFFQMQHCSTAVCTLIYILQCVSRGAEESSKIMMWWPTHSLDRLQGTPRGTSESPIHILACERSPENPEQTRVNTKLHTDSSNLSSGSDREPWSCEPPIIIGFSSTLCFFKRIIWVGACTKTLATLSKCTNAESASFSVSVYVGWDGIWNQTLVRFILHHASHPLSQWPTFSKLQ